MGNSESVSARRRTQLVVLYRVVVVRVVSKARTDAAPCCVGRSNKNCLITAAFPSSQEHRSERTSRQASVSNVCPLLLCVFVWPPFILPAGNPHFKGAANIFLV
jgi:hypothetical protein